MAKKSSNNAVKKLDKQIKDLENSIKEDKSETLPVLDKKKIEEEMKKTVTTKSNKKGKFEKKENSNKQKKTKENKKSSNIRENIIVNDKKYKKKMKNNRPIRDTIVAVDSNKKKVDNTKTIDKEKIKEELELKKDAKEDIPVEEGLTSDETVKLKKLEEQMRTLYDRVNDVVNDLDYDDSGVFDIDLLSEEIEKSNIDNNQKKKYKFKNLKFNKINEKISDIGGETINKISDISSETVNKISSKLNVSNDVSLNKIGEKITDVSNDTFNKINEKINEASDDSLSRVAYWLFLIFMGLFILFIIFVVFVSTF